MSFNVLIVDDSSSMRAVIKRTIKLSGFDVGEYFEAEDGREALELLSNKWVDIVLSDINMPNMTGMELIAEMKKNELLSSIPVILVTTEGSEKKIQESIRLGANKYIKKPFFPEEIIKALRSLMGEEVCDVRGDDESNASGDF
ncbi:MAG: response regulator [Proteobacteria bacterium]|nr:response regulator [Pseudomonadota bacterium]